VRFQTALLQQSCFFCAPSIGAVLLVKVLSQVDHNEPSEAQLHEGVMLENIGQKKREKSKYILFIF
jgi:hypothetical protein